MGHEDRYLDADIFEGRLADAENPVLIIGSAISLPLNGQPGVPGAGAMVERARAAVGSRRREAFKQAITGTDNPYQAAFQFLTDYCGPKKTNQVIREAVLKAREPGASQTLADLDDAGWHLTPGARALGRYMAARPGGVVLTTNFDPLIQVAIRQAGGQCYQTVLDRDGSLGQTTGAGVHVVHIHGFWQGHTLHTTAQLQGERLRLSASLTRLLHGRSVFVLGYGGWDDALMKALRGVMADPTAQTEVLWGFYGTAPDDHVIQAFTGAGVGLVQYATGIDLHTVLPLVVANLVQPFLDDTLIGRERLCRSLLTAWEKRATIQLLGLTTMGKTMVLRWLARELARRGEPVAWIDCAGLRGRSPAAFVQAIGDALGRGASTWQILNAHSAIPDDTAALRALDTLLPCTVLVDDADELALPGHQFTQTFFDGLRARNQDATLRWFSASRGDLHQRFKQGGLTSQFLNHAQVVPVGALEPSVWERLVREIGADELAILRAEVGAHALSLRWWRVQRQTNELAVVRKRYPKWVQRLFEQWAPQRRPGDALSAEQRAQADQRSKDQGFADLGSVWEAYLDGK